MWIKKLDINAGLLSNGYVTIDCSQTFFVDEYWQERENQLRGETRLKWQLAKNRDQTIRLTGTAVDKTVLGSNSAYSSANQMAGVSGRTLSNNRQCYQL